MKKLKLIYNPNSGDKTFKTKLDACINILQMAGFEVHIYRSFSKDDITHHIYNMPKGYYDTIVACGGDGTINLVLNSIVKNNLDVKLGLIPAGTANDFATYIGIPRDPEKACSIIAGGNTIMSDIGEVNGSYFINVCGAGLLTNISQKVDENFKNTLGKLAYYLKGLEQIQSFVPIPIKVTNSKETIEQDVYLLLVLNSAGAGGFERLAPRASVSDGLFDFIAFKAVPITDLAILFLKILKGDYLDDSNIIFFQDNYIKIESNPRDGIDSHIEIDIDGEIGPDMPIEIRNIANAIEIYCK